MENLPESPFSDSTLTSSFSSLLLCNVSSSSPPSPKDAQQNSPDLDALTPNQLVPLLDDVNLREEVMYQLIKKRDTCEDLPLLLWNTFNAVYTLLLEVITVYWKLSPSKLSMKESTRVCNALALFQVMARNPETRRKLIEAKIPYYFYPFLKPSGDDKPLEYLRLTSLGVLGSLAKFHEERREKFIGFLFGPSSFTSHLELFLFKVGKQTFDDQDGPKVLHFFLETEVVPLCLACMDRCDELSRKVATLIIMKILMQEKGMTYCCATPERFFSIVQVLGRVVQKLTEKPCLLHLAYVVQSYLSLSEILKFIGPCDAFKRQLPAQLFDNTFKDILRKRLLYLYEVVVRTTMKLHGCCRCYISIFMDVYIPLVEDESNKIAMHDTMLIRERSELVLLEKIDNKQWHE